MGAHVAARTLCRNKKGGGVSWLQRFTTPDHRLRTNASVGCRSSMKYSEFRETVQRYLRSHRGGATWKELKSKLRLSYSIPCPTWVHRLETEIGLTRSRGPAGMIWTVPPRSKPRRN
jgi:hypothetical protein